MAFLRKIQEFMYGRYGTDKMSLVLLVIGFIVSIFGQLFSFYPLIIISYLFYGYSLYRTFSKNIGARQKELISFLKFWNPIEKWLKMRKTIFDNRKVYKYFKCPNCKQWLRAPRGRGKIEISCQKCKKQFIKKV